jgi:GNAT superfamily N-acetyltransferase
MIATPTIEDLAADANAYLPGLDIEIAERDGHVLRSNPFNPHPLLGLVLRQRLEPESVADSVADARQWFRERGRARFTWAVADTATPAGLGELLLELGLRPDAHDPVATGMVLEHEPPGTTGIEVRRVETFEDQLAGHEVSFDSFELTEEEIAVAREAMRERWERVKDDPRGDAFVALVDGRVVGSAGASYTDAGLYLGGGNVAKAARGRGVYRALVRARWDVAVARGTPTLVVQAGQMSRPILERLGFRTVCEIRAFVDDSGG